MNYKDRYINILRGISLYYGMDENNFIQLLKDKEKRYLLLLLLKKYKCMDKDNIMDVLNYKSKKSILCNIKRAEDKLLINTEFREKFFEIEENLLK
ncbi:hypothetical protein [Clostridium vincentii]|uniref:Ribose 5-phosphate isomerase n=1 Tax=Clostridium vincentii TaxID=52704 RepID=A0A2T0BH41_9CLOT|nr:hypothetical protein [Clostridium vincentii]PRR83168.1 hypothetical protein CLVI_12100 [Clostridium vincentii]